MEVVWYLHGTVVHRPKYQTLRKFVTRLNVPAPANKKWSYLCNKVWCWKATSPLSTAQILRKYYEPEKDSPEKQRAMNLVYSLEKDAIKMQKIEQKEEKRQCRQKRQDRKRQETVESELFPDKAFALMESL